jgi:hypothetical protein
MDENLLTSVSLDEFPDDYDTYEADKLMELMMEGLMPSDYTDWNSLRIENLRGLICLCNRELALLYQLYRPNGIYISCITDHLYNCFKRRETRLLEYLRFAQNMLQQKSGQS